MENTSTRAGPKDFSHLYSRVTKNRAQSKIKSFYKYFAIPGIGQLAGGLPNAKYFPYDTLEAKAALPNRWTPSEASVKEHGGKAKSPPESHLVVPHVANTTDATRKIDLTTALQYGTAQGYPPLYGFIKEFTTRCLHPSIPYEGGADIVLTVGSTDGFSKALQCFNNEWSEGVNPVSEREGLIVEEFAYMNAIQSARPRGMNILPIAMDDEGMLAKGPGGLDDALENWDFSKGKRPHLMYSVTIGQNPTSGTLSTPRRKEIYAVCQKYDVIIVEDDPYWYLQYPSTQKEPVAKPEKSSGFAFLDSLQPSYLSIDVDGRVVRLDTFSKTVAPGCRLGWITASPAIIERLTRITESSTQQPSGFVQSMIAELLIGPAKDGLGSGGRKDGTGWDMSGWVRWLEGLRGEYERRMDTMATILEKGRTKIKSGRRQSFTQMMMDTQLQEQEGDAQSDWAVIETTPLYDFYRPTGGMFLWLSVRFENHPLAGKVAGPRLAMALWVYWTTEPYKVLVGPGTMFAPNEEIAEEKAWKYFRLCFAAAPVEELSSISKGFVKGIGAFFEIKDAKKIDDILKDLDGIETAAEREGMGCIAGWC
ncbi:aromatic amino acid aminotransferase [Microthyrium microscopicum]|uniref:Aromatic amino acid aminotransferase n=1 Tax=Microthyrium microscopicum TaxID=703497 RepID=A0A6A6TTV9_9PEZI|nr:aromatic amino acid aminotransferase [Microthyrium microscopicum]